MYQPYDTAAPKQLHASIPSPNGTHACLTLYDVCPHTSHSTTSSRSRDPYLHCDLLSLPAASTPRTIEYINKDGTQIVQTTHSTFLPLSSRRSTQANDYIDREAQDVYSTALTTHPKEKAMAASLAPLILSKHSPMMHHIRASTSIAGGTGAPLRSILKPTMPIIYLLTFSTDLTPTTKHFVRLLNEHLPPRVPLRYTIDARRFLVPSRQIRKEYSGVAEVTQDAVLRDAGARREVGHAVDELMAFVRSGNGGRETSIAVCCTAGTHRSVAIAECIARGVRERVRRGTGEVKVVVRHVHRVRGPKDPY